MADPLLMMAELLARLDLDRDTDIPPSMETLVQLRQLQSEAAAEDNETLLRVLGAPEQEEILRIYAARSIAADKATVVQVSQLGNLLLYDESLSIRLEVARTLRRIPLPEVITRLLQGLVRADDPNFRATLAYAVKKSAAPVEWTDKVNVLLNILEDDRRFREHLELASLTTAVSPPDDELRQNRYLLSDYLIGRARNRDNRMVGFLAGLLLEACGENIKRAKERIELYAQNNEEDKETWDALRSELGGRVTPTDMQAYLERSFLEPLGEVRAGVTGTWQATIRDARTSLMARSVISSLVSLIGLILFATAVWLLLWQQAWSVGLAGAILGLIVIGISYFIGGSVKEVRQTLTGIGVANAVYVAYMQRMLAISHAYARLYLEGEKPSNELAKESNEMVKEVVQDTVEVLRGGRPATLEDLIDQYS